MPNTDTTATSRRQWDRMAELDIVCSRPVLDLTPERAREIVAFPDIVGPPGGKSVLCLANGGGAQTAAYAFLGARVTSFDWSERQLERDRFAADHYGVEVQTIQGDARDLSSLDDTAFDIVDQGYSFNYVPDAAPILDGVTRVLKPDGYYAVGFHNPYVHGSWIDGCWGSEWPRDDLWRGVGYPLREPCVESSPVTTVDPHWNFHDRGGVEHRVASPQEYRHRLSTILNGLITRGFTILRFEEDPEGDPNAEPGTWEHYTSVALPWFSLLAQKRIT